MTEYTISNARYSRTGAKVIHAPSSDGYATRAQRLARGLKCRWSHRQNGYVCTPSKAAKFERLYAAGWDACSFSFALQEPKA